MNRLRINQEVCKYLEDILSCKKCDLNSEDIVFTINKQAKELFIKITTYKKCVIVSCAHFIYDKVKLILAGKNRDELFEFPLVYGQTIHYIPDVDKMSEPELLPEFAYEMLEEKEISKLYPIKGFDNSLVFDTNGNTSIKIVFIAKQGDEIIGIAGAAEETEKMWEVGIDVRPEYRNHGLGSMLVQKLSVEILKKDIVPFYSASVTNIGSQMVANRAGYIPCWVDTFGNVFDQYYSYDINSIMQCFNLE